MLELGLPLPRLRGPEGDGAMNDLEQQAFLRSLIRYFSTTGDMGVAATADAISGLNLGIRVVLRHPEWAMAFVAAMGANVVFSNETVDEMVAHCPVAVRRC